MVKIGEYITRNNLYLRIPPNIDRSKMIPINDGFWYIDMKYNILYIFKTSKKRIDNFKCINVLDWNRVQSVVEGVK